MINKRGPSTEPWGTPNNTDNFLQEPKLNILLSIRKIAYNNNIKNHSFQKLTRKLCTACHKFPPTFLQ